METNILRTIKEAGRTEALLESLVRSFGFLPDSAPRLFDKELLPAPLKRLADSADPDIAWCCWHLDDRLWFYMAEMSLAQSRERGRVVLHATSFDPDGQIIESAWWIRAQSWQRLY